MSDVRDRKAAKPLTMADGLEKDPMLRLYVNGLQALTRSMINGTGDWTQVESGGTGSTEDEIDVMFLDDKDLDVDDDGESCELVHYLSLIIQERLMIRGLKSQLMSAGARAEGPCTTTRRLRPSRGPLLVVGRVSQELDGQYSR
jgi:hypothetical protein